MSGKLFKRLMSVISAGAISVSMSPIDLIVHAADIETTQTTITGPIIKNETETVKSSDILTGDANLDGIVNADDSTVLADAITAGTTDELKHCDVDFSGVIDQTDADMIASYSTGEITYFPVGKIYNPEAKYITRAEWIHSLAAGFEMSVEDESTVEHYFTDLEDCEYAFEIELAANFGVFDVLGDEFNPNEYVTRDFAAHTMVFCLGIPADVICSFTDADAVYYDKDAQVALTQGWFATIDGEFRPSMYVTSGEAELAYADMTELVELSKIDENHDDVLVVDDSVIEITDTENITLDGDIVTITGSSTVLAEGDIFSVVVDDITIVRKAVTIETDEELGVMTVTTEACEEDVIESVEAEGLAYVDYENITPLSDELEVDVVEEEEQVDPANYFASPELMPKMASGTVKLKDISLKGKVNVGGGTLTLNGKLSNIKVPYKLETKLLSVKKFYLGFEADASLTANMHASLSKKTTKSVPIISVPVVGCGFLNANVVVSADISLSGDITLSYKCSLGGRIQYENGNWSYTKNFKTKSFTVEAMVDEKIGVRVSINVTLGKKTIGEIYASAGQSGLMKAVDRGNGLSCFDFNAHVYAELGANVNLGFGIGFKKTWQLINKNNSPIWIDLHFENGSRVPSCTYGKTPAKKASGSNGGGKSGGYTKGKGYSTGYASTASGGAAHGTGWTSKYYSSSIEFKELEPPMYITEDTVLTDDLTVDKDLYIDANLDLNGHKLTVDGNVVHSSGSLTFNSGIMKVTGDYTATGGSFNMEEKDDSFTLEGDFYADDLTVNLIAGKSEFKGNITSVGYDDFNASDMHQTNLTSESDQTIDMDSSNTFNQVVVENSESRQIIINNDSIYANGISCDGEKLNITSSDGIIGISTIRAEIVTITGNCTLDGGTFNGSTFNVLGNATINENWYLNDAEMTVSGDLKLNQMKYVFDGGKLTVSGDCEADFSGSTYWFDRGFKMNNKKDYMTVSGDFKIDSAGSCDFSAGTLELKGDVYLYGFYTDTWFTDSHKVILSSESDQNVYFDDIGGFNQLEIQNSDKRNIIVDGYLRADATSCGEKTLTIVTNDIAGNTGYVSLGTLDCSELNIIGDVNFYQTTKLNCSKATMNGNASVSGTLNLNKCETTVSGDFSQYNEDSELYLNGANLTVHDYSMSDGMLYMTQGTLNVNGDMSVNGHIYMQNEADHIIIKGDWDMTNVYSYSDDITAGTIECAGNITSTGESPFKSKGTFKLILNGEKDQKINMEYYPTDSDLYHFANLEVKNADKRAVLLKDYLDVGEFTADADTVKITTTNGGFANAKLRCNLNITGNLLAGGNVIDLNGKNMTVNGNLYQHKGTIQPNTGKLTVNDYFIITDEDSAVYGVSEGVLKMVNDGDYVLVNGDFITKTNKNHKDYLTAGTLEIKGDFYQYDDGTTYAFPASGKHMTVLSGDEVQNVTFESYDASHFNILRMEQAEDKYVFSDNPCWNEIASDTTTATTTTGTTTITTTTVTVSDTTTETVPTTTNKTTTNSTTTSATTTSKTTTTVTESTTTSKTTTTITESTTTSKTTTTISSETDPVAIIISNTTAAEGENVSIYIDIENNPGVANAEFDVAFDSECLEFIDAQSGDAMADAEFSFDISDDGKLHISFTGEGKESGTMAVLNFNVLKTPEDSKASVTIVDDSAKITDLNGENIEIEVIYDESTESNAGDVNNDGEIDLKDVVLIRRFIAGGWDVELNSEDADVNNDDAIDLKDVVLIRRYIAGGWDVELA